MENNWTKRKSEEILQNIVDYITTENGAVQTVEKICLFSDYDDRPSSKWSPLNRLIMMLNDPDQDSRTLKQFNAVGRSVTKNAKAFYIYQPITVKKKDDDGKDDEILKGWRLLPVFKFSDSYGKMPEYKRQMQKLDISKLPLKEIAEELNIQVRPGFLDRASGAYDFRNNEIVLNTSGKEAAVVMTHEIAHAVDKKLGNISSDNYLENYAKNECVAEIASCYLCHLMGIDGVSLERTKQYVDGWSKRVSHYNLNEVLLRVSAIFEYIKTHRTKETKHKETSTMKKENKTLTVGLNLQTKPFNERTQFQRGNVYVKRNATTGKIMAVSKQPFKRIEFEGMVASASPEDFDPRPAA